MSSFVIQTLVCVFHIISPKWHRKEIYCFFSPSHPPLHQSASLPLVNIFIRSFGDICLQRVSHTDNLYLFNIPMLSLRGGSSCGAYAPEENSK